jgi:hypothetical protein
MIWHDDKAEQKKWIKRLHAIQAFDCLSCVGWIFEKTNTIVGIRRDEHRHIILHRVTLRHACIDTLMMNAMYREF